MILARDYFRKHLRLLHGRIRASSQFSRPSVTHQIAAKNSGGTRIGNDSHLSNRSTTRSAVSTSSSDTGIPHKYISPRASDQSDWVQTKPSAVFIKRPIAKNTERSTKEIKSLRPPVDVAIEDTADPFQSRPRINIANLPSHSEEVTPTNVFDFDAMPAVPGLAPQVSIDDSEKPTQCCGHCGRTFNLEVIEKHERICGSQKKRQQFDSSERRLQAIREAQRAQGTLQENASTQNGHCPMKVKKASWKEKSDQLRAAVGLARARNPDERRIYEAELAKANEASLTRCDFCGRSFNAEAAKRHIPFCMNKSLMIPKSVPGKMVLGGTGASIKLPAGNRSRSEMNRNGPQPVDSRHLAREHLRLPDHGLQKLTGGSSAYRGQSLIQRHFR